MNLIHPDMTVWAVFRTKDPAPALPPELDGAASVDNNVGKYHPDAKSEIRIALHAVSPDRAVRALRKSGVRIVRHFLTVDYSDEFWDRPPTDCVGAILGEDGYVRSRDPALSRRIVPLSEPVYTNGRPEADGEHLRFRPHVLSHIGGVQVVSDELIATLRRLGAAGETAPIIYRGSNKKAYDTVQAGYQRFLPQPEYEMPDTGDIEFLPAGVSREFGICSMLRIPKGQPEMIAGILRNRSDDRWYDIALEIDRCRELRRLQRSVLLTPMFCRGGETDSWVILLESAVDEMKP